MINMTEKTKIWLELFGTEDKKNIVSGALDMMRDDDFMKDIYGTTFTDEILEGRDMGLIFESIVQTQICIFHDNLRMENSDEERRKGYAKGQEDLINNMERIYNKIHDDPNVDAKWSSAQLHGMSILIDLVEQSIQ